MNAKFKVGDKIRRIRSQQNGRWAYGNDIVEVYYCSSLTLSINHNGVIGNYGYDPDLFVLVESVESNEYIDIKSLSIPEQLKLARTLIGKDVQYTTLPTYISNFVVENVRVIDDTNVEDLTESVKRNLEKTPVIIVVTSNNGKWMVPFECCNIPVKPTEITVKLNDSYNAIVSKDTVKVGCKTFKMDVIHEIVEANKSLQ